MKNILAIIFSTIFLSSYSQIDIPHTKSGIEFEKLLEKRDTLRIIKHIRKFDSDFSSNWKLNKIETKAEIDHFKFGYNIEWIKKKSDTIIYRNYTFDIDGNYYYGFEQRELNDKVISRGGIEIENGTLKYIRQFYPERKKNILSVGAYEFELYKKGKLISIYRTRYLNHFHMLTEEKNKDEVELIYGIDFLNVKE